MAVYVEGKGLYVSASPSSGGVDEQENGRVSGGETRGFEIGHGAGCERMEVEEFRRSCT